jgi:hypothetical protein
VTYREFRGLIEGAIPERFISGCGLGVIEIDSQFGIRARSGLGVVRVDPYLGIASGSRFGVVDVNHDQP